MVQEILAFIEERLSELEKEKEELKAYEQLDKLRKAIEYNLYDKDLSKSTEQLSQIEITREEERERHQEVYGRFRDIQDQLQLEEEQLLELRQVVERSSLKRTIKLQNLSTLRASRASLLLSLQELQASHGKSSDSEAELKEELTKINNEMANVERDLQTIEPRFEELTRSKAESQSALEQARGRVEELYAKQGRRKQFNSVSERDAFLTEQLSGLSNQLQDKQAMLKTLTADIAAERTRLAKEKSQHSKAVAENQNKASRLEELSNLVHVAVTERNSLQERRKAVWREQETLSEKLMVVKSDAEKARKSLNAALPKHIAQGLAAVARIAEEKNLSGYLGPLIDNITLKSEAFRTCVEVAAGNALFHIVVDTDATAAVLMKELERQKSGRITFLPLNRIRNEAVNYPVSNDVRPLIDVAIEFDQRVEAAVRQVFGKKLLARDLEVATHFSKSSQLDAITRDGDLVNRRGGFEGGYYDERESRIAAVLKIRTTATELLALQTKEEQLKVTLDGLEEAINTALRDLQALERERDQIRRSSEQVTAELTNRARHLSAAEESLESKVRKSTELQTEVAECARQIEAYEAERGTPLQSQLSASERSELKALGARDEELLARVSNIEEELLKISQQRDELKAELRTNLSKRKSDVQLRLDGLALKTTASYELEIVEESEQLRNVEASIAELERVIDEMEAQAENTKAELEVLERVVGERRLQGADAMKIIDEATQMQDKV